MRHSIELKQLLLIALLLTASLTVMSQTTKTTQTVNVPVTIVSTNKSGTITKTSKIETVKLTKLETKRVSNPNAPVVTKSGKIITTVITNKDGTYTTTVKDRITGQVTVNTSIKQEMMIGQKPPQGMVLRGAGMRSSVKTEVKNNVTIRR